MLVSWEGKTRDRNSVLWLPTWKQFAIMAYAVATCCQANSNKTW